MSSKTKTTAAKEEATPALVPKLRFPEFREAEGWHIKPFEKLFTIGNGRDHKHLSPGDVPVYGSGGYMRSVDEYLYDGESVCIGRKGTINNPIFLTGSFWTVDTLFYTHSFNQCLPKFIWAIFQQIDWLKHNEAGGIPSLSKTNIEKIKTAIPKPAEQQKITECLSSVDELMAAQARKVDALKTHKKGLMQQLFPREGETQPRLRFPEFQNAGEWKESTIEEITATVTPPKKLQTSEYQVEGEFPIIDQSQNYICGWTNDGEAVIDQGLPVIVFGDHTCALKFIDCPFVQGADGIKILRPKRGIDIRFLFCALEANPVVQESYKRHFSMLKEKKMSFPDTKTGEQQHIADCLTSLDALITAETQKHEALKTHKKGLMQQLFPSPEAVEA